MVNPPNNRRTILVATGNEIRALAKKHGLGCSLNYGLGGTTISVVWTPPIPPEDNDKTGKHDNFILAFVPTWRYHSHVPGWEAEYMVNLIVRHEAHPEFFGELRPPKTNYLTLPELKEMPMAMEVAGFVEDAMIGNFPAL